MFILYTTEDMLYRICEKANSDCVCDIWYKIILSTKQVAIDREDINTDNQWIQILHRMGVNIYAEHEWIKSISNDNSRVLEEPTATFLLDFPAELSNVFQVKYGILCYSTAMNTQPPFFTKRGWHIDTSDIDKPKSWEALLSDLSIPSNSIVIVDRYLFSSNPGETIKDSFTNIIQILDKMLPQTLADGTLDVSIIFDFDTINFKKDRKKDGNNIDMSYLANQVNKLKKDINRPYAYSISLISINSNCLNYDITHNRKIFSNYYLIGAEHKIKAYNSHKETCTQVLSFSYIFSEGLNNNDRSTIPEKTKDNTINRIKEIIKSELNAKEPSMQIYRNGREIRIKEYSNVLLTNAKYRNTNTN